MELDEESQNAAGHAAVGICRRNRHDQSCQLGPQVTACPRSRICEPYSVAFVKTPEPACSAGPASNEACEAIGKNRQPIWSNGTTFGRARSTCWARLEP